MLRPGGQLAIRASSARRAVAALQRGEPIDDACAQAMRDVRDLDVAPELVVMNLVAGDAEGNHCGISTRARATYAVWDGSGEPRALARRVIG